MKKIKKVSLILGFISVFTVLLHLINKITFFLASMKDILYSENSNYYNWRFGKIFYTKKGIGSPILLIHDLNCTSSDYEWRNIIKELSQTHTVYTLDLLGCGRSEKPKMTYTNYLYVQLVTDFVKNIIKHSTDLVVTGKSTSIAVMSCYIDSQIFRNIVLINPTDINYLNKYPKYKNKLLKHIIDLPIIGTTIYNILVSKTMITDSFKFIYFHDSKNVKRRYIDAYNEAAHLSGAASKYIYSSIKSHYTNTNIIHALKDINNSIYIIGGEQTEDILKTIEDYIFYNPAIESSIIANSKLLPQIENPSELLRYLDLYLN